MKTKWVIKKRKTKPMWVSYIYIYYIHHKPHLHIKVVLKHINICIKGIGNEYMHLGVITINPFFLYVSTVK